MYIDKDISYKGFCVGKSNFKQKDSMLVSYIPNSRQYKVIIDRVHIKAHRVNHVATCRMMLIEKIDISLVTASKACELLISEPFKG